jgi:hypothetical protein
MHALKQQAPGLSNLNKVKSISANPILFSKKKKNQNYFVLKEVTINLSGF